MAEPCDMVDEMKDEDDPDRTPSNLYGSLPTHLPEEMVDVLLSHANTRIERIVTTGQVSDDGFWYDQCEHEWVVVLQGEAKLRFEDTPGLAHLRSGDFLHIRPHQKHRVEWTSTSETTVWLAVFFDDA